MATDLTALVTVVSTLNTILTQILNAVMDGGTGVMLPNYTVGSLPAAAADGELAFASNGRKPGEGAGVGTGVPVFFNGATASWFTTLLVAVTA